MGLWSFYFLAKLGLYAAGLIGFNWLPNLVFALFLGAAPGGERWRRWRFWIALPIGIALFWADSFWPPFVRVLREWDTLIQVVPGYWLELLARSVSWRVLGGLLLGGALWYGLNKRIRLGALSVIAIASLPVLQWAQTQLRAEDRASAVQSVSAASEAASVDGVRASQEAVRAEPGPLLTPADLTRLLQRFYDEQQGVTLKIAAAPTGSPPFDLVFISVDSLSWDDLRLLGLERHPALTRLDLLFRHFNSAASYSVPAVLRLLQAPCGQAAQSALTQPAPAGCYLLEQLEQLGYDTELRLNHEGNLGGFAQKMKTHGRAARLRVPDPGLPVAMKGVDDTPIRHDLDVLKPWIDAARTSQRPRALIYNTITLRDGHQVPGIGAQVTKETRTKVTAKFLGDLQEIMRLLETSGRPTVMVLVPEHGAAIEGDPRQMPGMREFPTPRLTDVPAGLALLGFGVDRPKTGPVIADQSASYAALVEAVSVLSTTAPQRAHHALDQFIRRLPAITWVAENDSTVVIQERGRTYMRTGDADWTEYPAMPPAAQK